MPRNFTFTALFLLFFLVSMLKERAPSQYEKRLMDKDDGRARTRIQPSKE